jgi:hypothetical protein
VCTEEAGRRNREREKEREREREREKCYIYLKWCYIFEVVQCDASLYAAYI